MSVAAAEWETIREAFRLQDAATLLALCASDAKRGRLASLLVKNDFLPGAALAEMHLDNLVTLEEAAATLDYLNAIS